MAPLLRRLAASAAPTVLTSEAQLEELSEIASGVEQKACDGQRSAGSSPWESRNRVSRLTIRSFFLWNHAKQSADQVHHETAQLLEYLRCGVHACVSSSDRLSRALAGVRMAGVSIR